MPIRTVLHVSLFQPEAALVPKDFQTEFVQEIQETHPWTSQPVLLLDSDLKPRSPATTHPFHGVRTRRRQRY